MIIRRFYDWPVESHAFLELNRMRSEMESLFGRLAESLPTGFDPGVVASISCGNSLAGTTLLFRIEWPDWQS
jgi:hypothetical protein